MLSYITCWTFVPTPSHKTETSSYSRVVVVVVVVEEVITKELRYKRDRSHNR